MKLQKKHIKYSVAILFLGITALFAYTLYRIKKKASEIELTSTVLLQNAIKKTVLAKETTTYYALSSYEHKPEDMGKFETRTVEYADTSFVYQIEIADRETDLFRSLQTLFLYANEFPVDTLNAVFDSLCAEQNIYVKSAIHITAQLPCKKSIWSKDTTDMNIKYRVIIPYQGEHQDINYYAYMETDALTYWQFIPKPVFYILIILILLLSTILTTQKYTQLKNKRLGFPELKDDYHKVGNFIVNTKRKEIICKETTHSLSKQQYNLLIMFLITPDKRIHKTDIKEELWQKNENATSNMTTAVKRLKDTMQNCGCNYTIVTDGEDKSYYILRKL